MTAHFVFALAIVPLGISVCIIYKGWPYVNLYIIEKENDDLFVFSSFRRLLKSADKKMVIYDDGDKTPGSLYESPEIVEMIKEKLAENKHFVIVCSFNLEHTTLFKRAFADEDRVRFAPGRGGSIHYKIIDDGKIAYLSSHSEGSVNRKVKIYDFSDVRKRRWQDDVKEKYIGEHLRDSERLVASC